MKKLLKRIWAFLTGKKTEADSDDDDSLVSGLVTASNGLSYSNGDVRLGGNLNSDTSIDGNYNFSITAPFSVGAPSPRKNYTIGSFGDDDNQLTMFVRNPNVIWMGTTTNTKLHLGVNNELSTDSGIIIETDGSVTIPKFNNNQPNPPTPVGTFEGYYNMFNIDSSPRTSTTYLLPDDLPNYTFVWSDQYAYRGGIDGVNLPSLSAVKAGYTLTFNTLNPVHIQPSRSDSGVQINGKYSFITAYQGTKGWSSVTLVADPKSRLWYITSSFGDWSYNSQ